MAWNYYNKGNKYGNKKISYNGATFDSKKELKRWMDLTLLEKQGSIQNLQRQVKFVLIPAQREADRRGVRGGLIKGKLLEREVAYYADFVYWDNSKSSLIVEDAKGLRTTEYIIKRKLLLYVHGIKIKEI